MSRSNSVGKVRRILESDLDVKTALLEEFKGVSQNVFHNNVLVATHPGEKYHAGTSILRTDVSIKENEFQGTVGLVIARGPLAFQDDPVNGVFFAGATINEGDWVLYRPADGLSLFIKELPCRVFRDVDIKMKVTDPSLYW